MKDMKKKDLKEGVFYTHIGVENHYEWSLQYNKKNNRQCSGYWEGDWRENFWGFPDIKFNRVRESTLEELNALGDEHLPYSKYLQATVINTNEFKLGQRVKVNSGARFTSYNGLCGIVSNIDKTSSLQPNIGVRFDGGVVVVKCYPHEGEPFDVEILDGSKVDTLDMDEVGKFDFGTKQMREPKQVRRFKSGAVRSDDRGRLRPDYISPYALEEIAEHFTQAAKEFGADDFATNYFKGIEPKDVKGSISRHYIDLQKAFAEKDDTMIREEIRAMACNCIMALHQIRIAELGLYVEEFEKTEYITKD